MKKSVSILMSIMMAMAFTAFTMAAPMQVSAASIPGTLYAFGDGIEWIDDEDDEDYECDEDVDEEDADFTDDEDVEDEEDVDEEDVDEEDVDEEDVDEEDADFTDDADDADDADMEDVEENDEYTAPDEDSTEPEEDPAESDDDPADEVTDRGVAGNTEDGNTENNQTVNNGDTNQDVNYVDVRQNINDGDVTLTVNKGDTNTYESSSTSITNNTYNPLVVDSPCRAPEGKAAGCENATREHSGLDASPKTGDQDAAKMLPALAAAIASLIIMSIVIISRRMQGVGYHE